MIPLIIIDMQPQFEASGKILKEVKTLCKLQKSLNNPIRIVEYSGCGKTYPELARITKNKPIVKFNDDGSKEIIKRFLVKHPSINTVRLCGVNYGACVARTAAGLLYANYKVRVNKTASANSWDDFGIEDFKFIDAVKRTLRFKYKSSFYKFRTNLIIEDRAFNF